jgi:hypothetical protein
MLLGVPAYPQLPFHLSAEVDALYRRNGFTYYFSDFGYVPNPTSGAMRTALNDWQFPLLLKYETGHKLVHPFVDAGATYRHLGGSSSFLTSNPSSAGFTLGGGVSIKVLFLRISPEIRYTRWGSVPVFNAGFVDSKSDQADILVGPTF